MSEAQTENATFPNEGLQPVVEGTKTSLPSGVDTLVEEVARALCRRHVLFNVRAYEATDEAFIQRCVEESWRYHIDDAKVAIEAMPALSSLSSRVEALEEQRDELQTAGVNLTNERNAYLDWINDLKAEIETLKRERDEAKEFAHYWHSAVDTICTILGLSNGLGAVEAITAVRAKFEAADSSLQQIRTVLERLLIPWSQVRDNNLPHIVKADEIVTVDPIPGLLMGDIWNARSLLGQGKGCSPSGQGPHRESTSSVEASREVVPEYVLAAIKAHDDATRAHLKDCWLGSDEPEGLINARYEAYRATKAALDSAFNCWTGRHATEFQAQQHRDRASGELNFPDEGISPNGGHPTPCHHDSSKGEGK